MNLDVMTAFGFLIGAVVGPSAGQSYVDGLPCFPTSPASMTVTVGQGSIMSLTVTDTSPYGSVPANSTILNKMGINPSNTSFALLAPTTAGQSINYLIEGELSETDVNPLVLPYYNSTNPTVPLNGPGGTNSPQNTVRTQTVALQLKSGAPATTGTQSTPATDAGWVPLYVITVPAGATSLTAANIAVAPGAPFLRGKIGRSVATPKLAFTTVGLSTYTVPAGVGLIKIEVQGAGGGAMGGSNTGTAANGAGGGAGGYTEGYLQVVPGATYSVVVGAGGAGGLGSVSLQDGVTGGSSSFGPVGVSVATALASALLLATGGVGGGITASFDGGFGGVGSGGTVNLTGGDGQDGCPGSLGALPVGNGGASFFGGGGRSGTSGGNVGRGIGAGGGAGYASSVCNGGPGANGAVFITVAG